MKPITSGIILYAGTMLLALPQTGSTPKDSKSPKRLAIVILTEESRNSPMPCDEWIRKAMDPAGSVPVRLEAVRNLVKICRERGSLMQEFSSVALNDREDLAVRSAMVRAFLDLDDGGNRAMFQLLRALSVPGIRPVAIETLDRLAPVTGPKASRLHADLVSLRRGSGSPVLMRALPGLYGRDPRVLEFLKETLRTGNRWDRALAASVLCGLGEVEPALTAAGDADPRVRKSLAAALGWFHEQRGAEVLLRLSTDANRGVAREAGRSAKLLSATGAGLPIPGEGDGDFEWRPFLKDLSEFRLSDAKAAARLGEKAHSGWLGEPGATEPQIQALEQRLGRRLPPSYRAFLAESNGFHEPGMFIPKLYGTDEVQWFTVRNAWAKEFRDPALNLASSVQISASGLDGDTVVLIPGNTGPGAEWQLYIADGDGGTHYRSFREFMQRQLDGYCDWRNY